ncbi:hypothetical protein ACOMHN_058830 [Nucella lapillus]
MDEKQQQRYDTLHLHSDKHSNPPYRYNAGGTARHGSCSKQPVATAAIPPPSLSLCGPTTASPHGSFLHCCMGGAGRATGVMQVS